LLLIVAIQCKAATITVTHHGAEVITDLTVEKKCFIYVYEKTDSPVILSKLDFQIEAEKGTYRLYHNIEKDLAKDGRCNILNKWVEIEPATPVKNGKIIEGVSNYNSDLFLKDINLKFTKQNAKKVSFNKKNEIVSWVLEDNKDKLHYISYIIIIADKELSAPDKINL